MADKLIAGTAAAAHVHELIGDETLSTASVWADQVKGRRDQTPEMLAFKSANPNHPVHHYADIPFEEPAYRDDSIGATNVDVVHAIPACILILQGKASEQHVLSNVPPRVALRLLVHYIEDIHQAALCRYAGYLDGTKFVDPNSYGKSVKDDQGANRLVDGAGTNGGFEGTTNLHFFWDTVVVRLDMTNANVQTPGAYAEVLLGRPAPAWQDTGPLLNWDRDWANESVALSAKVHDVTVKDEDDSEKDYRTGAPRPRWHIKDLTPEYTAWACKTAEQQMTKAGYRVAASLKPSGRIQSKGVPPLPALLLHIVEERKKIRPRHSPFRLGFSKRDCFFREDQYALANNPIMKTIPSSRRASVRATAPARTQPAFGQRPQRHLDLAARRQPACDGMAVQAPAEFDPMAGGSNSVSGKTFDVFNPADGARIARVAESEAGRHQPRSDGGAARVWSVPGPA